MKSHSRKLFLRESSLYFLDTYVYFVDSTGDTDIINMIGWATVNKQEAILVLFNPIYDFQNLETSFFVTENQIYFVGGIINGALSNELLICDKPDRDTHPEDEI